MSEQDFMESSAHEIVYEVNSVKIRISPDKVLNLPSYVMRGFFLKHIFYWCYYEIVSWDKLNFCSKFSVKAFWMIQIDRILLCSKELKLFHIDKKELLINDKKELLIKLVRNWKGTFKVMKFYFSLVMILWNFRVSNKSSCSSPLRLTVT